MWYKYLLHVVCELFAIRFILLVSGAARVASGPRVKLAGRKSALSPHGLLYWPF